MSNIEIDSESLEKILEYFNHYNYHPPTTLCESSHSLALYKCLSPWDIDYLNTIGDELLVKLLHCCHKLEISPILEMLCLHIALLFRDIKTIEKMLKIKFESYESDEVRAFFRKKYSWAFS